MSTIAVNAITDANGGSTTSINGTTPNAYNTVGKNLIINGAMQIAQRGTSASISNGNSTYNTVDRFTNYVVDSTSTVVATVSQSTDAPDGFSNSYKWQTTTSGTLPSSGYCGVQQFIEAQTVQHLAYGTSSAKKVTLSFWVKSSVTGTYAVSVYQDDANRITGSTYTINTANTWEKKTVTFDGDTSGTINNDNGEGFRCIFHTGAGSDLTSTDNTSWGAYSGGKWAYGHAQNGVIATTNATWQITGVQLEVGESATEFEHRPYGTELQLCQRYYEAFPVINGGQSVALILLYRASAQYWLNLIYKVEKRAAPTFNLGSGIVWTTVTPLIDLGKSSAIFLATSTGFLNEQSATGSYSFALDSEL